MLATKVPSSQRLSRFRDPPERSSKDSRAGLKVEVPVRRQLINEAIEGIYGNANTSLIDLVGSQSNVVELQTLLEYNESKLLKHISEKKFPSGDVSTKACQDLHPGLYKWLSETSPVPSTVVTKMRPDGWKATRKAKRIAELASNKQRRERCARIKVVGGSDSARNPKSVPNSGIPQDHRSALAVNASYFSGMFQRLMSLQYHVEYVPDSYDSGNRESFLPSIACSEPIISKEQELQVINELQEEFRKIALLEHKKSLDDAIDRGYGTQYTMNTAGERFLAENVEVSVKDTSYEATRYRIEGDKSNVHFQEFQRYQNELERMYFLNNNERLTITSNVIPFAGRQYGTVEEIKALARMCWKTLEKVPPLSRKQKKHLVAASKREMKQNHLNTQCLIDNSNKVLEITGSPLTSPDNTLCIAAKYQIWLWKHGPINQSLHTDRYEGVFSASEEIDRKEFMFQRRIKHVLPNRYHANAVKAKYGLEDSDMKVPAIKGVQSDKPVQRSDYIHESDYVMASRRNKVVTSIRLEVDTPWKSVQGTRSSLIAANDPINPSVKTMAQEVCGPQMPDEVSEMRNSRRRTKCNLHVFKKGGMSRARARIAQIEESKYKISTFNAKSDEGTKHGQLIYMPPTQEDVVDTAHDDEWSDNFVREFMDRK